MKQAYHLIDKALAKRSRLKLVLDLSKEASQVATSYFLRAYRGRADLSETVLEQSSENAQVLIEKVRNHIFCGEYTPAAEILATLRTSTLATEELLDVQIERARLALFQGILDESKALLTEILPNTSLPPISKLTVYQLLGNIHVARRDYPQAIRALTTALALSEAFPTASSAISSRAFLVQCYSAVGEKDKAASTLQILYSEISSLESDELWLDRLLTCVRAEYHYARAFEEIARAQLALQEGIEIARFLRDAGTESRCTADLAALPKCATPAETRGSFNFGQWKYLARHKAILNQAPKKVSRVTDGPVTARILELLCERPRPIDELFEATWLVRYDRDRHYNHVQAMLSKIRKLLPKGALHVIDGIAELR